MNVAESELNISLVSMYEFYVYMLKTLGNRKLSELLLETGIGSTVDALE